MKMIDFDTAQVMLVKCMSTLNYFCNKLFKRMTNIDLSLSIPSLPIMVVCITFNFQIKL